MWKLCLVSFIAVYLLPAITCFDLPQESVVKNKISCAGGVCQISCSDDVISDGLPKQCKPENHNTLSEVSRSTNYPRVENAKLANCDGDKSVPHLVVTSPSWAGPGWYKLATPAGTKMATSSPGIWKCGSSAPGYMVGEHPTEIGQTKSVKFCFDWDKNHCKWSTQGEVTKCGEGDFVYNLPTVPYCALRYCAAP